MNSSIAATLELKASSISSMGMSPIRDCVSRTGTLPETVVKGRSHSCVHPHNSNGSASPSSWPFLIRAFTVSVAEGNSEMTRRTGLCAMPNKLVGRPPVTPRDCPSLRYMATSIP